MPQARLLLLLTFAGAVFCWWPGAIEPAIHFPSWLPLAVFSLLPFAAASLVPARWPQFAITAIAGAVVGLAAALLLVFPPHDGIARSYAPLFLSVAMLISCAASVAAAWVGHWLPLGGTRTRRRFAWLAMACAVAFGPLFLALTPPLVAHRIAVNDRLAEIRFQALRQAVAQTVADTHSRSALCNGQILKQHYAGPPFSDGDWQRIAGNYVRQDGHDFMLYCREAGGGYTIVATIFVPYQGDGNRSFCTDESGVIGCAMSWNRSRNACLPCDKSRRP